jgi:hypothetical protein
MLAPNAREVTIDFPLPTRCAGPSYCKTAVWLHWYSFDALFQLSAARTVDAKRLPATRALLRRAVLLHAFMRRLCCCALLSTDEEMWASETASTRQPIIGRKCFSCRKVRVPGAGKGSPVTTMFSRVGVDVCGWFRACGVAARSPLLQELASCLRVSVRHIDIFV